MSDRYKLDMFVYTRTNVRERVTSENERVNYRYIYRYAYITHIYERAEDANKLKSECMKQ